MALARFYFLNITILIAGIILGISGCSGVPPYNETSLQEKAQSNPNFKTFHHHINGHDVAGVMTSASNSQNQNQGQSPDISSKSRPAAVFIHGAPGNWQAWGQYLNDADLLQEYDLIAVDRPGFGQSGPDSPVLSLKDQSSLIMAAILKEHPGPFLLIGHSYGGPVQLQMAIDYPGQVSGLLILAGAIDPVTQKSRWYHYLADTWAGRSVLPQAFNITTKEMLSLPDELVTQQASLGKIAMPVTVIQGKNDWLVPAPNADYAHQNLTATKPKIIILPKQGHFLPWEQFDLIKGEILRF